MALDFTGAASDKVTVPDDIALDMNVGTALTWCQIGTYAASSTGAIYWKGSFRQFLFNSGIDEWALVISRPTDLVLRTTPGNLGLTAGEWNFVVASWDTGAGADTDLHLYGGDLTTVMAEATSYTPGKRQVGSGTPDDTSSTPFIVGNRDAGSRAWDGQIAFLHLCDTQLSLVDIEAQRLGPFVRPDTVYFKHYGLGSALAVDQVDWSGNALNASSVSGVTLADHVPIPGPLKLRRRHAFLFLPVSGVDLVKFGNDTVNLSEGSQASLGLHRFGNDDEQINEATLRPKSMRRFGPDTEELNEGTVRPRSMNRFGDDVEELDEASQPSLGLLRFGNDTEELSDAIDNVLGLVRFGNDTIEITEATPHLLGLLRFAAETVELTEGLVRFRAMARLVADTVQVVEGTLSARDMSRFGDDTEEVTEALVRFRAMARVIDDTVEISEVAAFVRGLIRAIADTEQITEVALFKLTVALAGLENFIDEVMRINEASIVARALVRVLPADTEEVSEGTAFRRTFIRFGADTEELTEATAAVLGSKKQIAETEQVSEGTVAVLASPARIGVLKIRDDDDIDWREIGPVFA